LLFQTQNNLKEEDLKAKANKLGLDGAVFNSCLDSSRRSQRVREDIRAGAGAGTDGTPALYINGRFLSGNRPFEDIAAIVDEELKTKR
jgi:predicted DsbA family dithiol-disulfide isomerase